MERVGKNHILAYGLGIFWKSETIIEIQEVGESGSSARNARLRRSSDLMNSLHPSPASVVTFMSLSKCTRFQKEKPPV